MADPLGFNFYFCVKLRVIKLYSEEEFIRAKTDDLLPIQCENCKSTMFKKKHNIQCGLKGHPHFKYTVCLKCHLDKITKKKTVQCENCGNTFKKIYAEFISSKHHFCSNSCHAYYMHKHHQFKKRRKSQAESYLTDRIKKDFPELEILCNTRSQLDSGLEIDIFLKTIKLAIEINGPIHYFPIHGEDKLSSIKKNDERKISKMRLKGFNILIIDISKPKGTKATNSFLDQEYPKIKRIIKILIKNAPGDGFAPPYRSRRITKH